MRKTLLICTAIALCSCDSSAINKGEFSSLDACLKSIQTTTGTSIRNTSVENPDQVVGVLSDGSTFWCKQMTSSTKGTYFEGTFEPDD
jgi:hypothetical protein